MKRVQGDGILGFGLSKSDRPGIRVNIASKIKLLSCFELIRKECQASNDE